MRQSGIGKTVMITIDGSYGEGGGQIIRTSVSLAAMTGQPMEVVNVRAGRSKPGLKAQHLTAVRAAAELCAAQVEGAAVGSQRFAFRPQSPVTDGEYYFDIGTAGAVNLVAQTVLLPLCHQPGESRVVIKGGTHVPFAPVAEYLEAVYLPALRRAGMQAQYESPRAGFFPKGGGQIILTIDTPPVYPLDLTERGKLVKLTAYVITANLPDHVGERGATTIEKFMKGIGRPIRIVRRSVSAHDAGAAVVLAAECEGGFAGFSALGERGKPMEKVATDPCEEFLAWWKGGAPCDEHLADQLALPMALAVEHIGESRWTTATVTEHLRTVLWVIQKFLPLNAVLQEEANGSGTVILSRR